MSALWCKPTYMSHRNSIVNVRSRCIADFAGEHLTGSFGHGAEAKLTNIRLLAPP